MCANNYLGLANNPEVIQAAKDSYEKMQSFPMS
jgi:7-keto-8-aminopelargonate synthetase-like enzyme